jgi:16S rRNA (guanine527-N7)-methyltransferase
VVGEGAAPDPLGGSGLRTVLERSRTLGFLGEVPTRTHLDNARAFLGALDGIGTSERILDLGSGGGVPGLAIAIARPDLRVDLLDVAARRCEFLRWAVSTLGLEGRCDVHEGRAEDLARSDLERSFDIVTARSFGPPAATAECAVGFLEGPGSCVLVSEPPGAADAGRWPDQGLARLGLVRGSRTEAPGGTVQALVLNEIVDGYPRRSGMPTKRPLF